MGHTTLVYGVITGAPYKNEEYHKWHKLNNQILASLPDNDPHFPWIHRNMFNYHLDPEDFKGTYRDHIITFGATYKSVEYEWDAWLEKFESILMQLYWIEVVIHLETELVGKHTYKWLFDSNQKNNWLSLLENSEPTTMWTFEGGPRKFF